MKAQDGHHIIVKHQDTPEGRELIRAALRDSGPRAPCWGCRGMKHHEWCLRGASEIVKDDRSCWAPDDGSILVWGEEPV